MTVTPAATKQADWESETVYRTQTVAEELEPYPVLPHNPIGPTMRAQGEVIP